MEISGADEIGSLRFYKGVTIGTNPAEAAPHPFTNQGAALLPWAPCHIRGVRDDAGNLTLSWVRRTRYGGGLKDGTGTVDLVARDRIELIAHVRAIRSLFARDEAHHPITRAVGAAAPVASVPPAPGWFST